MWNGWEMVCADFYHWYGGMDSTKVESRNCPVRRASPVLGWEGWALTYAASAWWRVILAGADTQSRCCNQKSVRPRSWDTQSGVEMGARAAEAINAKIDRLDNTATSVEATVGELAKIVRELQSHQTKETPGQGTSAEPEDTQRGWCQQQQISGHNSMLPGDGRMWNQRTDWIGLDLFDNDTRPSGHISLGSSRMSETSSLVVLGAELRPLVLPGAGWGCDPTRRASWHATACSRWLTASSFTLWGHTFALVTKGRDNFTPNAGWYFARERHKPALLMQGYDPELELSQRTTRLWWRGHPHKGHDLKANSYFMILTPQQKNEKLHANYLV